MQSEIAYHYDTRTGWGKQPDSANLCRIKKTLGLVPENVTTVLDLGCGDGIISNTLVEQGIRTIGIDISNVALQHFRGTGIIGSINALPFPDSYFDLVLCAEVLEHLPPQIYRNALNEIERIAKWYILITTPNEEYLPANYVKCQKCGYTYHMNLHMRSLSKKTHLSLFPRFNLIDSIGILSWKHNPFIVFLKQKVFGFYKYKDDLVCPRCHHQGVSPKKQGVVWEFIFRVLRKLDYELPAYTKPRWIASLYRRK
jgi:SAM-dependent methyltransferase